MKKRLLFSIGLSFFVTAFSFAQPTLQAVDLNPVVGDHMTGNDCSYIDHGPAGANITWNLSAMTVNASLTTDAVTPASTGKSASFPNANIALSNGPDFYAFYHTSSAVIQAYGFGSPYGDLIYSNPEDMLHYPLSYTNSFTDTWRASASPSPYPYYSSGSVNVSVDGYGTLITPTGTYHNVLRVHAAETRFDSAFDGTSWIVDVTHTDSYSWYLKGNHNAIAGTDSSTSTDVSLNNMSAFYLTNVVAVNEPADLVSSFSLYPNPAVDHVMLDIDLISKQRMEVRVYNAVGSLVRTVDSFNGMTGENRYRLDVADLSKGIYFVQLLLDGNSAAERKFVVMK